MKTSFKKPSVFWFLGIFLAYMTLNVILSQFYVTLHYLPYYLKTLRWPELLLAGLLSTAIGVLVSLNMVSAFLRYRERRAIKKESALTCAGTLAGLATGICSACVAGIVPLLFSFLGISFSWAALPLKGMEVQAMIIAVLAINLIWLNKK